METNHYDVVVCGGELTGLVAGALLGRRGLRVLVCGLDRMPGTFDAAGFRLSREPGLLPPPDAEPLARVLRELNYVPIVRRRAPAFRPALQLVLPEHRLDLDTPEVTEREVAREFPDQAGAILEVLDRLRATGAVLDPLLGSDITLPPDGFWERREVARVEGQLPPPDADLLAPLPPGHPLRAGLTAFGALSTALAPVDLGSVPLARAWARARAGAHRLEGGGAALRALLLDKLGTSSGEIREALFPAELVVKRGRVAGARMRPRDETIGFDHLVWAGPAAGLLALCGDRASRRLREIAGAVRPACYRYTICLLLRPEGIPEGMGPRVIAVREPAQPLLEDNALALTIGAPRNDQVPVWVECLVPAAAASAGSGYLPIVRSRVREQLARLLPFFERHLIVLASPHDGLPPELPSDTPGAATAEPVPATAMAPALTCDLPRAMAVAGTPHATGLKNVHLGSVENLPGLGREGEIVSGWGVARLIAGPRPRRDLGRREILIEDA